MRGGPAARPQPADFTLHGNGKRRQGRGPHRLQQVLPAGKVPIRGIGHYAGTARGLAQHDGVGATLARQVDAGVQQRTAQVSVAVGGARRGRGDSPGHADPLEYG
ncbi:hypothetical protein D9M72_601400 [compost metagenome]